MQTKETNQQGKSGMLTCVQKGNTRRLKALGCLSTVAILATTSNPFPVSAAVQNGWETINGNRYWYENGVKQGTEGRGKEICDPATNDWYWLDAEEGGKVAVSKDVYQESYAGPYADGEDGTGKWSRYDAEGHMVKGWDTDDSGTCYFDPIYGAMVKGWQHIDGIDYYFNETTGRLESCSISMDAHWETIDGIQYWYEAGIRQGYDVNNANYRGKEIYDPDSKYWYWLDNVQQGAKAVSKDVFQESQADDEGNIGKWVRYDADGHMVKGWDTRNNETYYFDLTYGTMAKGFKTIDGVQYEFDQNTGVLLQTSLIHGADYVLNTNTKKIHNYGCRDIPNINPNHYFESGNTLGFLYSLGYTDCGHCRK